jgi:protease-4
MNNRGFVVRTLAAIWRGLDRLRRLLHLILLLGLFIVLAAWTLGGRLVVPGAAALVIAPNGALVDQLSGDALERALARARGTPLRETLLRDVVDALRAARDDQRIKIVVLKLDGLSGSGLSKLQELAEEIAEFKKSGKQVTAIGDGFTRDQ